MILAGFALAAFVWSSWPDATVRIVRLPDGEAMPKSPREAAPARAKVTKTVLPVPTPAATVQRTPAAIAQPETGRVLAAVAPDPSAYAGPAPVPSELELSGDYEQESPEALGAEPLPGADLPSVALTPEPPPVAR